MSAISFGDLPTVERHRPSWPRKSTPRVSLISTDMASHEQVGAISSFLELHFGDDVRFIEDGTTSSTEKLTVFFTDIFVGAVCVGTLSRWGRAPCWRLRRSRGSRGMSRAELWFVEAVESADLGVPTWSRGGFC